MNYFFAADSLHTLRQHRPIIHHITNLVVMQHCANILLALGASPIMAHAPNEIKEILSLSHALVINIGTLDEVWLASMQQAQQEARLNNMPIVFDPVGVGASTLRTSACRHFLKTGVSVLRANASEILALYHDQFPSSGIDSQHNSFEAMFAGKALSKKYNCIVIISGPSDLIIQQEKIVTLSHGTPLFTRVTGMGCALGSVIAAFLAAAGPDPFSACIYAVACFTIAGEIAEKKSTGPGSFQMAFLDALFNLSHTDLNPLTLEEIRCSTDCN